MLRQTQQQRLSQKLSPQQIQLMKLLQIPTTQLEERIKEELEEMMSGQKTIEDVVLGTYQGKDYAADEDDMDPNNFKLFDPVTFAPIEPPIVIPKLDFQTDWSKTSLARKYAMPASKRKPMQKKQKPAPKWAKGYM